MGQPVHFSRHQQCGVAQFADEQVLRTTRGSPKERGNKHCPNPPCDAVLIYGHIEGSSSKVVHLRSCCRSQSDRYKLPFSSTLATRRTTIQTNALIHETGETVNEHAATVASVPDDTSGLAYDLGDYRRQIVTSSPEAQRWFDIGLRWAYCFNFEEAVRCFEIATQHDPECVMAYWGMVYASGPNYNSSWQLMDAEQARRVIREVHSVFETVDHLAHKTSKCELDLINAIRERFPRPTDNLETVNFASLNMAYAEAMRTVYERHGDQDIDVATLYVDALMCVSPRALWNVETGEVIGYGAIEARQILENVMKTPQGLKNPALPHLYVHLMEMSPFPELAQPSADRLRGMAPDASHTVHMATHIDHACGDWRRVIDSNRQAADVDDRYFADTDAARSPMYHGGLHPLQLTRGVDSFKPRERPR